MICRLSDLRHVKVNAGFLEMTGYTRDAVIGRSVYEVDVLAGARNRDLAISRLNEGATIPQMEACLDLPDGGTRFVIVAGQPMEMGDEPCMLFTFADLELRRKAETALRQSEERFAKAFRLTPVPTAAGAGRGLRRHRRQRGLHPRLRLRRRTRWSGARPPRSASGSHDAARTAVRGARCCAPASCSGSRSACATRTAPSLDCLVSAERVDDRRRRPSS